MEKSKIEVPYALVPDYNGYPENSPLKTFRLEIDKPIYDKLVDNVNNYDDCWPDGSIIKDISAEFYNDLLNEVKSLEPDWQKYQGIEIYIPENIHFFAKMKELVKSL